MTKHYYNIKLDMPQDADSAKYFIPKGYTAKLEDGVLIIEPEESEDERIRKYIVNFVELNKGTNLSPDDADRMLAYLERQKKQKPSEEQMKELELIINGKAVILTDFIRTLYNDLKKLM